MLTPIAGRECVYHLVPPEDLAITAPTDTVLDRPPTCKLLCHHFDPFMRGLRLSIPRWAMPPASWTYVLRIWRVL